MNIHTKLIFVAFGFYMPVYAMDLILIYSGLKPKNDYTIGSVVAYDKDEEIGFISFFISSVAGVNGLDITRLTVGKGFRRQGVGTHLVKKVEKIAHLEQCQSIEVVSTSEIKKFWQKLQYFQSSRTVFYEKHLDPILKQ